LEYQQYHHHYLPVYSKAQATWPENQAHLGSLGPFDQRPSAQLGITSRLNAIHQPTWPPAQTQHNAAYPHPYTPWQGNQAQPGFAYQRPLYSWPESQAQSNQSVYGAEDSGHREAPEEHEDATTDYSLF
jgi:hypothetical protein